MGFNATIIPEEYLLLARRDPSNERDPNLNELMNLKSYKTWKTTPIFKKLEENSNF
jgi:hypothetical protein